jgi:hypothetical protein
MNWLLAWMELNYQQAYWESVAQNEWWLKLLMEIQNERQS